MKTGQKDIGKTLLNNDLWELNAGSPDGQTADGSANEYALRSFFGRLTYDYDNRYLVEAISVVTETMHSKN